MSDGESSDGNGGVVKVSKHYHYAQRDIARNPVSAEGSAKYDAPVEVTLSYLYYCDEDNNEDAQKKLTAINRQVDEVFGRYNGTVELCNQTPKIVQYTPMSGSAASVETVIRYRGTFSFQARYKFLPAKPKQRDELELFSPTQADFAKVIRFNKELTSGDNKLLSTVKLTDKRYEFDDNIRDAYTLALTLATAKARERAELMAAALAAR